jgi:hypothetical protein
LARPDPRVSKASVGLPAHLERRGRPVLRGRPGQADLPDPRVPKASAGLLALLARWGRKDWQGRPDLLDRKARAESPACRVR